MARFTSQFMTEGAFDYTKFNAYRQLTLPTLEEADSEEFARELEDTKIKAKVASPPEPITASTPEVVKPEELEAKLKDAGIQQTMEVFDANAVNGAAVLTIDEATGPTQQHIKQGVGIARAKRGNMTGAVNAMDKIHKGIAKHPAVEKELRKQNEDVSSFKTYAAKKD